MVRQHITAHSPIPRSLRSDCQVTCALARPFANCVVYFSMASSAPRRARSPERFPRDQRCPNVVFREHRRPHRQHPRCRRSSRHRAGYHLRRDRPARAACCRIGAQLHHRPVPHPGAVHPGRARRYQRSRPRTDRIGQDPRLRPADADPPLTPRRSPGRQASPRTRARPHP